MTFPAVDFICIPTFVSVGEVTKAMRGHRDPGGRTMWLYKICCTYKEAVELPILTQTNNKQIPIPVL